MLKAKEAARSASPTCMFEPADFLEESLQVGGRVLVSGVTGRAARRRP
jgi:hypothetical protein